MGARQKLNAVYLNGSIALAAFLGLATQSWWIFIASLVVILASFTYTGNIRPKSSR
jgi:1,4-dihydroxy-2-naphthoate octaprenyltransferase